ncbi:MAG: Glu-tRNA(Gln) amidotransferase subunit GatD [Euryarchaeota archaeon]|jgi:glutamyl-tRNA(Gln) amidotransferase subunit D|nr:Glu-tRNA(Gln) amidotransferase subunit GatD [Euryarchaeota archaeon]MBT4982746.1 Glu-tRNA(Gln) amidotransferase subunit GatD [Euryarchaeota archaeon]
MVEMPTLGSRVRIEVNGPAGPTTHEGVVLPGAASDHLTIKLVNGYNVSHPLSMVTTLDILGDPSLKAATNSPIVQNSSLPKVTIIHTGGTIASKVDYATGAVIARFEPEELLSSVPGILDIANIDAVKLGNMWSDDIRPQHWNQMIEACENAFAAGSVGVVITHGTDTLHISSAALSFAFSGNGGRPAGRIVFTGSQRSSDRASSDATENLLSAVYWAANGPDVTGEGDSAVTVMHAGSGDGVCAVSPGVNVRKMHSTKRDAFQTVNGEILGEITISKAGLTHTSNVGKQTRSPSAASNYDVNVKIAQFIAGPHLQADLLSAAESSGYSAIIIHGTGLGHLPIENPNGDAPENDELAKLIESCTLPVIVANQCINGPVDLNVYSKGRLQQKIGVLGHGSTSSPEALLTKVHWALSNGKDLTILSENLCGENNPSLMS